MSSEPAHLVDIADLNDAQLDTILAGPSGHVFRPGTVVGLLFMEASLRTRLGFATAAARLGATPIYASELRYGLEMSAAESFSDTLRCVAGMCDLVVVRSPERLDRSVIREQMPAPVINGGDRGGEHPTQALIDLAAMERLAGPICDLTVTVCGDLTMRASTSLLQLLNRRPPKRLRLIAPHSRSIFYKNLGDVLRRRTEITEVVDFSNTDALLMTGLAPGPDGELSARKRSDYALTTSSIGSLPPHAVVLSPMPIIDEIDNDSRNDPRVRIHDHSDLGVSIRMATLQLLLAERLLDA